MWGGGHQTECNCDDLPAARAPCGAQPTSQFGEETAGFICAKLKAILDFLFHLKTFKQNHRSSREAEIAAFSLFSQFTV